MTELAIIILVLIVAIFVLSYHIWLKEQGLEEKKNRIRRNTLINLLSIIISTFISFAFSINADIPDSAGLGGLMWIFGPFFIGLITIVLYLIFIFLNERLNILMGILLSAANITFGIYLFSYWMK